MELYSTLAVLVLLVNVFGVEIDLHFKVVQENLLLLSDCDTSRSLDCFDFVYSNVCVSFGYKDFGKLLLKVACRKLSVVLFFVEPRVVVPDGAKAYIFIFLLCGFH
jgi:hypothetical protein